MEQNIATLDLGAFLNFVFTPLFLPIYFINQLLQLPAPQMQIPEQRTETPQTQELPQMKVEEKEKEEIVDTRTTYANNEEWELKRDKNGQLEEIVIHRKATRSK